MECPVCHEQLREDTKFCPYCGTALSAPEEETPEKLPAARMIKIAESYTGNMAAAREIAAEAGDIRELRTGCVRWIQARNKGLFEDVLEPEEGREELRELENLDTELIPLDYEERIVILMHVTEGLSDAQIAEELGISPAYVQALLQSAFVKNYPAGKESTERSLPVREMPVSSGDGKKTALRMKIMIIAAASVVLVLGIVLAFRRTGSNAYRQAMEALEKEDYDTAVEQLQKAVRFGVGGDETVWTLADALYHEEDYAAALVRYEDYYKENRTDKAAEMISRCCHTLADQYLTQDNAGVALEYLRDDIALTSDVYAQIRTKAIEDPEGICTDENGNRWDVYGHLLYAICRDMDQEEMFDLEVQYDEDGHYKSMKAFLPSSSRKNVYASFDFSEDAQYEVMFVREKEETEYQIVRSVYEDDLLQSEHTAKDSYTDTRIYTYTYNEDGTVSGCRIEDTDTGETAVRTYVYQDGVLESVYEKDDDTLRTAHLTYDESGRIIEEEIRENVVEKVLHRVYAYDESGRLTEVTEERSEKEGRSVPGGTYRQTVYTWSAGRITQAEVRNRNGRIIGHGIYVPDNGMLYLYDRR